MSCFTCSNDMAVLEFKSIVWQMLLFPFLYRYIFLGRGLESRVLDEYPDSLSDEYFVLVGDAQALRGSVGGGLDDIYPELLASDRFPATCHFLLCDLLTASISTPFALSLVDTT